MLDMTTTAPNVHDALDCADDMTTELRVMAARLDMVAEQLDLLDEPTPLHADALRAHADQLVQLATSPAPDPYSARRDVAHAKRIAAEWAHHIARATARRMLGQRLFEQIADVSIQLSELALVEHESYLLHRGELPAEESLAEFDCSGMRGALRTMAEGFTVGVEACGGHPFGRAALIDALASGACRADAFDTRAFEYGIVPRASRATHVALCALLDEWCVTAPRMLLLDLSRACEATSLAAVESTMVRDEHVQAWWSVGIACAIARHSFRRETAAGRARMPITASVFEWIAALTMADLDAE